MCKGRAEPPDTMTFNRPPRFCLKGDDRGEGRGGDKGGVEKEREEEMEEGIEVDEQETREC